MRVATRLEHYGIGWNHLIGSLALSNMTSRAVLLDRVDPQSGSMRSDALRVLVRSFGWTREELHSGRPVIGIARTGSDLSPCERHRH
jgi:dihydroxyacid dehydratase/phosphogluconate dehydratase